MQVGKEGEVLSHQIEVPADLIEFYTRLSLLQDHLVGEIEIDTPVIGEEEIRKYLEEQQCWLQAADFPLNASQFAEHFLRIASFIEENRPHVREEISALAFAFNQLPLVEVAEKALWLDRGYFRNRAKEHNCSPELFLFLVENAIRPQLRAWANCLSNYINEENWRQPFCPVCGQRAIIARLRAGDGHRFLFCGHCFTEWEYRHLVCLYCGNDDHHTINIISIEGDSFNLIYACEKCRGYIKTLNERKGGQAGNLFVEGARTFYLDVIAEREGYFNQELKPGSLH